MAEMEFPLTLHVTLNLTGTTVPTEVASEAALRDALKRQADATDENARTYAEQLLRGSEISLTVRGRATTLYLTQG